MSFFKKIAKGFKKATKFTAKTVKKSAKFAVKNVGTVAKFALPVASLAMPLLSPVVGPIVDKLTKIPAIDKIGKSNFLKMAQKTIDTGATLRSKIVQTLPKYGVEATPVNIGAVEYGLQKVQKGAIGRSLPTDRTSLTNSEHIEMKANKVINSQTSGMKAKLEQAWLWVKNNSLAVAGGALALGLGIYLVIKRK